MPTLTMCTRLLPLAGLIALAIAATGCDLLIPPEEPGPGPGPSPNTLCSNSCTYARDGECDDGGPGAIYNLCALGTDCADCGPRTRAQGDAPPSRPGWSGPKPPLGVDAKSRPPVSQAEWWKLSHGDGTPDLMSPTFVRGLLQGAGATC